MGFLLVHRIKQSLTNRNWTIGCRKGHILYRDRKNHRLVLRDTQDPPLLKGTRRIKDGHKVWIHCFPFFPFHIPSRYTCILACIGQVDVKGFFCDHVLSIRQTEKEVHPSLRIRRIIGRWKFYLDLNEQTIRMGSFCKCYMLANGFNCVVREKRQNC